MFLLSNETFGRIAPTGSRSRSTEERAALPDCSSARRPRPSALLCCTAVHSKDRRESAVPHISGGKRMVRNRVTRRRFLQVSGAGAVAAQGGGIAGILASGRAPAYAQGTTLHWLRWNDFVPASDQLLKTKIAPQCEKDLGIKLNIEGIGANDLQARVTSSIQSGTGPDMILALSNWPQLYADSVVDVSDVVEEIGKEQGGHWDLFKIT